MDGQTHLYYELGAISVGPQPRFNVKVQLKALSDIGQGQMVSCMIARFTGAGVAYQQNQTAIVFIRFHTDLGPSRKRHDAVQYCIFHQRLQNQ